MTVASAASEIYGEFLHECVCCRDTNISFWRRKYFQYTESSTSKEFRIYRCNHCGSGFLNEPPHMQWLASIYQYSGQALTQAVTLADVMAREKAFPNCTVDAKRISTQAHRFNTSNVRTALDIGSGFGFYTQALRRLCYQTVSINPGQYENQVFREMNGNDPLEIMFESYRSEEKFGVVVMSQVLEHLLEPDLAIAKVASLLADGGVLSCAVPNYQSFLVKLLGTRDNACLWVPEHVNYFTGYGLQTLLERNGLQVVKLEQTTRIPFDAISKRLGLKGNAAVFTNNLVKLLQIPLAKLVNRLGLGIYINVYAIKKAKPSL